jgi:hypothetical protein
MMLARLFPWLLFLLKLQKAFLKANLRNC